jgi:hypothetical protein
MKAQILNKAIAVLLVFMFAPCINSDENSFIVPKDALNNIKPQL